MSESDRQPADHPEDAAVSAPETDQLPPKSQHVAAALRDAGIDPKIRELTNTRTAADAARALGCSTAAIANSLVFMCDGAPLLIMTSGSNRVDTQALAQRLGAETIVQAKPDQVRAATGQAIGGVAPIGHPAAVKTIVDEDLAQHAEIWAAGGTPHTVFPMTYRELLAITDGQPTRVTS